MTVDPRDPNFATGAAHPAGTSDAGVPDPESEPPLVPRVLVADDNHDLQQILARQLVLLGLEVVGVSNGRSAVDLALSALRAGRPFDLILMDLEMPILDGYQATRQVREGGYTGPILALTAHSNDDSQLDCPRLGCNECLCKPFHWEELRDVILRFLPGVAASGPESASGSSAREARGSP